MTNEKERPTSFRFDAVTREKLRELSLWLGQGATSVIKIAIRELHKQTKKEEGK